MHNRGHRVVWFVFALCAAGPAAAQDGGNIDLQAFRPAMDSRGFITLNGSQVLAHGELSFGLVTNWGKGVLRFESGENRYEVEHVVTPTLTGAVGLRVGSLELELGASLPFGIMSGGRGPDAQTSENLEVRFDFSGQGVGDAGLHAKWRLLHESRAPLGLAIVASAYLPTATQRDAWLGNDSLEPQVILVADKELGPVTVALSSGVSVRTGGATRFEDSTPVMTDGVLRPMTRGAIEVGSTIPFGAAIAYAVVPEKFDVIGEVYGAVPLMGENYFPFEAIGGLKLYMARNSFLTLGGGVGVLPSRGGSADLRAFLGIVFEPSVGDRDGDGKKDDVDQCPDDPEDFDDFEDDDGCPELDNDRDGILDTLDRCPNDPEDKDGIEDEDGCPEGDGADRDGDKILDSEDSCPDDPEDYDDFEDTDGCPDFDNDRDKILDVDDLCPNDPENYNGKEDDDGCPDSMFEDDGTGVFVLREIHFEYDSAVIQERSHEILANIARELLVHTDMTLIEVQGHTDERGADAYNLDLSQRRAQAVVDFLVSKGVRRARLKAHGYGESVPISTDHNERAWSENRRVEFVVLERKGD